MGRVCCIIIILKIFVIIIRNQKNYIKKERGWSRFRICDNNPPFCLWLSGTTMVSATLDVEKLLAATLISLAEDIIFAERTTSCKTELMLELYKPNPSLVLSDKPKPPTFFLELLKLYFHLLH